MRKLLAALTALLIIIAIPCAAPALRAGSSGFDALGRGEGEHSQSVPAPPEGVCITSGYILRWSGTAESYDVAVYLGDKSLAEYSTSDTKLDISRCFTQTGAYRASVCAVYAGGKRSETVFSAVTVYIRYVKTEALSLDSDALTVAPGASVALKAKRTPADGTARITWTSSNAKVATVADGIVTGRAKGVATITVAAADGARAKCVVTVDTPPSMALSGLELPETNPLGKSCGIAGRLTSEYELSSVTVTITDSQGKEELSVTRSCSGKIYDLSRIDSAIRFGTLSKGEKTFTVAAANEKESRVVFKRGFTVVAPELLWPCPGRTQITSRFGYREWSDSFHYGIDVTCRLDDIVAVADGTVAKYYNGCAHVSVYKDNCGGGLGNYVIIKHENEVYTVYAHLKNDSIPSRLRSVGASVKAGEVIGISGSSGSSTGYHLHFGIRIGGIDGSLSQDPELYFIPK